MSVKLLVEHNLEFLSLKGGCIGSSESTLVKMPHCCKLHVTALMIKYVICHCIIILSLRVCHSYILINIEKHRFHYHH